MWGLLFLVGGGESRKNVELSEAEVNELCRRSSDIFLSQPMLLELDAPLKICGKE